VAHPSGGVGDDPGNDTSNLPVDTMIVRPTPLADLTVTKTAPATVRSGEQNLSERRVGIQPVRHSEVDAGEERSRMSLPRFPLSPAVEPEASAREVVHRQGKPYVRRRPPGPRLRFPSPELSTFHPNGPVEGRFGSR
jgi:hypothetical protein